MVGPIHRRARLTVARAVINLVNDAESMQLAQVELLDGQVRDDVESFQPLGITSVPSRDAEAVAVSVGGQQDHTILLGVNDRSIRPTGLQEGETKIYSAHGNTLYLNASGECVLENSTGSKITLASNGNINVVQSGTLVNLASASDFVALAAKVDGELLAIRTGVNAAIAAINIALLLYDVHTQTSTATFAPQDPASGGQTVTVAAPTPITVKAIPLLSGSSTAATNVKAS